MNQGINTDFKILTIIWKTCIPLNALAICLLLWKLRKVRNSDVNKSFSVISIWIIYQIILGSIFCIIVSVLSIYSKDISNKIGEKKTMLLFLPLFMVIILQPEITTITQVYEWEAQVQIMKEQKNDTIEETFAKMSK